MSACASCVMSDSNTSVRGAGRPKASGRARRQPVCAPRREAGTLITCARVHAAEAWEAHTSPSARGEEDGPRQSDGGETTPRVNKQSHMCQASQRARCLERGRAGSRWYPGQHAWCSQLRACAAYAGPTHPVE